MAEMILHWLKVTFANAILSFSTPPCVSVTLKAPQMLCKSENPGHMLLRITNVLSIPVQPLCRQSQILLPAYDVLDAFLTRAGCERLGAYVFNNSVEVRYFDKPVHSQFIIGTTNDVILRDQS